jgi:hypothetical protein
MIFLILLDDIHLSLDFIFGNLKIIFYKINK